jgi:hypothetical protein
LQTNLNKWATTIKLSPVLEVDGDFGSVTEAAVKLALTYFDYSAANVALGEVPEALWTSLEGTPPVTPPADPKYGPPTDLKVALTTTVTAEFSWAAPAAVAGLPAASEYSVFLYKGEANEAHIVSGFPQVIAATNLSVEVTAGDIYILHVVASGADGADEGSDVFASATFTA